MIELRKDLPPMPKRMRGLHIEARGYPVPWFVQWIDGKPDFRVVDSSKFVKALKHGNCWLCGEPMGVLKTFVIGPMCAVTRTTSEPACHHDCAEFAATACPFMILPKAKRREANLPAHAPIAGYHLDRNPGATCLWTTKTFKPFNPQQGGAGILIEVGEPVTVEWFSGGKRAGADPVMESISSGLHHLWRLARQQGIDAMVEFENCYARLMPLLPASSPSDFPA
jgi:hypothetical protein